MRRILAALMLLSGCSVEVPNEPTVATGSVHPSKQLGIPECPTLPPELPITITGRWGIDALLCEAISNSSREKLFQVYVGAHPDTSESLRYGETTNARGRGLVWFHGPNCQALRPCKWKTFLPTGDGETPVMMITFTSSNPDDFRRRVGVVSQLRQRQ